MCELAFEALDEFWQVLIQRFPERRYGELSPERTIHLHEAAADAIEEWIRNNVPGHEHGIIYSPTPPDQMEHTAPESQQHRTGFPANDGYRFHCADIVGCESWDYEFLPDDENQGVYRDRMCKGCEQQATDLYAGNPQLMTGARHLREASQQFYDRVQDYLDLPDRELPGSLVKAMDALEAAWHRVDATVPEDADGRSA